MKIAIAYPPLTSGKGAPLLSQNRQFQWFNRPTYIYPVVPACAATMAKAAGHAVTWLDGIASEMQQGEFLAALAEAAPDLVLIETKTPVVHATWDWVATIKRHLPGTLVAICGDHVTALPRETMEGSEADYVLTGGDYDFLLVNLAAHIEDETVALEPGIWFRGKDGEPVSTGLFQLDHDLNAMPRIDRELTQWRRYSVRNGNYRRTPGAYIMAGRDCWHGRCTFCSWTTLYPSYRTRTPESVADEVGELIEKFGVREIMDDTGCFPVGDWLRRFCAIMIERGYSRKVYFDCNMRFGALSADDYALMKKAGFRFVLFGLESANQATLDLVHKRLKVEEIREGARLASAAGLDVHVTVMLGYPWENAVEIERTVGLARELLRRGWAYTLQATMIVPYPGTPLFRECREKGLLLTERWEDYDMRTQIMRTPVPAEDIRRAIRRIYHGFLHPLALWNRLAHTRHPLEDARFYIRGALSLLGHLKDFGS
ncbi:MAG: radical SAM protein [Kiritimatiellae bacterium]|nr:radical SAM protein [Kiritimatiellia bacterium]